MNSIKYDCEYCGVVSLNRKQYFKHIKSKKHRNMKIGKELLDIDINGFITDTHTHLYELFKISTTSYINESGFDLSIVS